MKYMIIAALLALFVAACAPAETPQGNTTTDNRTLTATLCPDTRPEACTREYMPVCGDNGQTYGNGCEACADQSVNSYEQGTCAPTLTVLYAGAFTLPEHAQTIYTLNGNVLTKETMTYENVSTSVMTKELSSEEMGALQDALAQIGELENSYTSDTMVTDVGYAVITVNGQQTTIDPNIDESYPEQLMPLREWINEQAEWFWQQQNPEQDGGERLAFTECTEPRPEACTQQYDPVCGSVDTGIRCVTEPCPSQEYKTYGNSCSACSNQDVFGYFPGACEDMQNQANV